MKNSLKLLVTLLFLFGFTISVKAYEFTDAEQEYINEFYGSDFYDKIDNEEYKWIKSLHIDDNGYEIQHQQELSNILRGTVVDTAMKHIVISKSCDSTKCFITTNASWKSNPKVRSYDVIGARFSGSSLINVISTKVYSSSGTSTYSNYVNKTNGFGCSVKLPTSSNIQVIQKFNTNKSGRVYASYQHAVSNISLANSKKYTISSVGMGGVFSFNNSVASYYDNTQGVYIDL